MDFSEFVFRSVGENIEGVVGMERCRKGGGIILFIPKAKCNNNVHID